MPKPRGGGEGGRGGRRGGHRATAGLGADDADAKRPALGKPLTPYHISECPRAPAAQQPLHPRRKRRLPSPPPGKPLRSRSRSELSSAGPSSQNQPPTRGLQLESPESQSLLSLDEADVNVKVEDVNSGDEACASSSSGPKAVVESTRAFENIFILGGPSPSPSPSSPFVSPCQRQRGLMDAKRRDLINAGSEDEEDSDEDNEDYTRMMVMSRLQREAVSDDEDETDDGGPEPEFVELRGVRARELVDERESVGGQVGPVDMYAFDWAAMGPHYVPDPGRKEEFAPPRDVGSIRPFESAYDAFTAIWNDDIMRLIVAQTNNFAEHDAASMIRAGVMEPKSRIRDWVDTDVDELYVLFAIDIAMGMVAKPLTEYWSKTKDLFETPGFGAVMSRNRYMLLKRCLHFNENLESTENLTQPQVKLHKIQPIIDHLNERFSSLYVPDVDLVLDESLTQWEGLSINKYINEAASIGIKSYEVCESNTGYLYRFEVHAGHENVSDDPSPVTGIIPSLVLRSLRDLEYRGHTVWMDFFYNSPALARVLKSKGFDCVGTLRMDRQFVPTEVKGTKKNHMSKGGVVGVTSGDVDIVLWSDINRLALISTYHGNVVSRSPTGDFTPDVVQDYNLRMGGLDKKDLMLAAFPMERKRTKVWYKKIFKRLVNVSILNAYVLLRSSFPASRMSHRQFRKQLCQQLLEKHLNRRLQSNIQGGQPLTQRPRFVPEAVRCHFPEKMTTTSTVNNRLLHKTCVICKKKTLAYCPACDVALCAFTCFRPYHS